MSCGCEKNQVNEALELDDISQIRLLIRKELAKIFNSNSINEGVIDNELF